MLSVLGDGAELRGADRSEVRRMREENGPRAIDVLVPIQRSLRRFDIEIREDISEVQAHLLKRVETVSAVFVFKAPNTFPRLSPIFCF